MRLIGVIDLADGRAVHARGGHRDRYAPVGRSGLADFERGDAIGLARAYLGPLGLGELYVADLDAITGRAWQPHVVSAIAALDAPVWLDAGISSPADARRAIQAGAALVVVGLETLTSFDALAAISAAVGGDRVAFSLDLRGGEPLARVDDAAGESPPALAAQAADAGAGTIVVIDLARVGSDTGPDLGTIGDIRAAVPHMVLLAGGGVRGLDDLAQLADVGCDGALLATAVHSGRLAAADLAAARHFRARR